MRSEREIAQPTKKQVKVSERTVNVVNHAEAEDLAVLADVLKHTDGVVTLIPLTDQLSKQEDHRRASAHLRDGTEDALVVIAWLEMNA